MPDDKNFKNLKSKKSMKKIFFVIVCVLIINDNFAQKRPAVIERPVFEVWNSSTLDIDKIEMSASATIFYIDAYSKPNSKIRIDTGTYIRESGSNVKLMITRAEGIELNQETFIPESGTASFKLFFPPLKPETAMIDFMVGDCEYCIKIFGIHLLPDAKIKFDPIPKDVLENVAQTPPTTEYSLQPAKLSGRFLGYTNGLMSNEITLYTYNILSGEDIDVKLPIADDGSFSGEIKTGMAGIIQSSIGNIFLIPGQETKIYTDLKKSSRYQSRYRTDKDKLDIFDTYVSGYFTIAELYNISQSMRNLFVDEKLMQETVNMNPDQFKQYLLNAMNLKIAEFRPAYLNSTRMMMMMETYVKFGTYMVLMQYESFIISAYMQVNNIKREDRDKVTFKPPKPDAAYYSFLKDLLIDDNMSYHPSFSNLIKLICQVDHFNLPGGANQPPKERFAYFKNAFASVMGTDQGMLFDLIQARFYGQKLSDMKVFTDAEKQELRDVFSKKPVYAEALIAENDKTVALIAANKENKDCVAHETPTVPQEKVFDAIIAKYKGKVVMVDFWATWCGPCMVAMKSIDPLKEEMKGKDVVWLYLTGETSPLNAWTRTYPTISGEHYRVSDAQWGYWGKIFEMQGIPTYMVIDKEGKQIAKYTGFPGVEVVKKDIEKGL